MICGDSMDNAKLVEYNLDITLGCPKCDYLFQLSNYSIPTEGSTYQVCENCQIPLEVKPISIDIDFKKPVKIKVDGFAAVSGNPTQNVEQKDNKKEVPLNRSLEGFRDICSRKDAKSIIKTYGFSMKEINHVLNSLDTDGMAVETIVKDVLSRIDNKHESAKT